VRTKRKSGLRQQFAFSFSLHTLSPTHTFISCFFFYLTEKILNDLIFELSNFQSNKPLLFPQKTQKSAEVITT
jgi:hypothetical protein